MTSAKRSILNYVQALMRSTYYHSTVNDMNSGFTDCHEGYVSCICKNNRLQQNMRGHWHKQKIAVSGQLLWCHTPKQLTLSRRIQQDTSPTLLARFSDTHTPSQPYHCAQDAYSAVIETHPTELILRWYITSIKKDIKIVTHYLL